MRFLLFAVLAFLTAFTGCSSAAHKRDSKTFPAGDKVSVDHLTYSIIDTEIQPRLGDDASPRVPQNRFYLVQVSVSNSANSDLSIPSLTLVDDSGSAYAELPDGTGVPHWLGVVRKVDAGQTEQGYVAFDAPASHYKLKLSDETSDSDIYADIPLSFVHERIMDAGASAPEGAAPALMDKSPAALQNPGAKPGPGDTPQKK